MFKIQEFDHIAVVVADLERSVEWYGKHLGMAVQERGHLDDHKIDIAYITGHGLMIELFQLAETQAATEAAADPFEALEVRGIRHFALAVDDIDACADYFRAEGIDLIMDVRTSPSIDTRICFIRDPDGVQIEFVQRMSADAPRP